VRCPQRIPLRKITSHALSAEDSGRYSRVAVFPQLLSLSGLQRNLHSGRAGITEIGTMAETYVPLISSGIAGPLGVVHLPRLWQKVSLEESGKLASGYPGVGKGFDAMTLAAVGLEEQAVRDYIRQSKPNYPQFETWVKKNAKSLNRDAVEKHNAAVRDYNHDDETRKGILGACKIADDASSPKDAVNLNNLDDWYEFHQAVLA
jgi:hypothetical protein